MRKALDILCLAMVAAYLALIAAAWDNLPDVVPSHFDAAGVPDAYGDRSVLLLEPVVALALWALLAVARRRPELWNFPVRVTPRNRAALYAIGEKMMAPLVPLTVFLMLYVGLMGVWSLPVAVLYLALAGVLVDVSIGIARMLRHRDA